MNWTEVNIYTTTEGIEPVCGRLLGVGITGFVIKDAKDFEEFLSDKSLNWDYIDDDLMSLKDCETCVTFYLADNSQGADCLALVRQELSELSRYDSEKRFGRLTAELASVCEEDWANNWKQYFKPMAVGGRLIIKPSWESCGDTEGRQVLEIDPGSSFGTGQHNTTRLCLELLEDVLPSGARLLDLGCGSGILSIAAMLLGADECTAVDIDKNSVRIAGENAAKNNIPPASYRALVGDIISDEALRSDIGGGYDIITANIVADVLIAMAPLFGGFLKRGGRLIASGIIAERCGEVAAAISAAGFSQLEMKESDGWAALLFSLGECEK